MFCSSHSFEALFFVFVFCLVYLLDFSQCRFLGGKLNKSNRIKIEKMILFSRGLTSTKVKFVCFLSVVFGTDSATTYHVSFYF